MTTPATHLKAGVMPKTGQRSLQTHSAPSGAHLTYYGGKVIPNVQVTQVLYGAGTYTPEVASPSTTGGASIASFYTGVTNSTYFDWQSEYNTVGLNGQDGLPGSNQAIGRGSFLTQRQITPSPANSGTTIDDIQIQAELRNQIAAGNLPAPTVNTLYALYFPANVTVTQQGTTSGVQFCAYHGTVAGAGNVPEFYYSVLPDFTTGGMTVGCGAGTTFQNETSVSSHEMIEAVTDAEVGISGNVSRPLAWYDMTNGETGDICNAQQQAITGGDGHVYTVQLEWSNAQNSCAVNAPPVSNDFSMSLSPTGGSLPPGGSTTSTVSTTATSGASTVSFTATGQPSGATVNFNPASVAAGGAATMTVATSSTTSAGAYMVTVTGSDGSKMHTAGYGLTVTAPASSNFSTGSSITTAFQGADHQLWTTTRNSGGWSSPESLGSPGNAGITSDPGVATMTPNTLDVFARGADGDVWYRYRGGSAWSVWVSVGAPPSPNGKGSGGVDAVAMKPGTLDVVTTDGAGQVWYLYWSGTSWSGWVPVGAPPGGALGRPAAISITAGTMDIWTVDPGDHHLWFEYWGGTNWSAWIDLGGSLTSGVDAASMGPGSQDVFGRAADGSLTYIYTPNGSSFSGWVELPGTIAGQPSAASQSRGTVDVFATQSQGGTDSLSVIEWNGGGAWSAWMTPWNATVLAGSSPASAQWTCTNASC